MQHIRIFAKVVHICRRLLYRDRFLPELNELRQLLIHHYPVDRPIRRALATGVVHV